jgi:hypothetical protein
MQSSTQNMQPVQSFMQDIVQPIVQKGAQSLRLFVQSSVHTIVHSVQLNMQFSVQSGRCFFDCKTGKRDKILYPGPTRTNSPTVLKTSIPLHFSNLYFSFFFILSYSPVLVQTYRLLCITMIRCITENSKCCSFQLPKLILPLLFSCLIVYYYLYTSLLLF